MYECCHGVGFCSVAPGCGLGPGGASCPSSSGGGWDALMGPSPITLRPPPPLVWLFCGFALRALLKFTSLSIVEVMPTITLRSLFVASGKVVMSICFEMW